MHRGLWGMALLAGAVALAGPQRASWGQPSPPRPPTLVLEDRLEAAAAMRGYALRPRRDGQPGWEYTGPYFTAYVAPDGSVTFRRPEVGFQRRDVEGLPDWDLTGVNLDLTEAYLRSRGEDPYAPQKAAFLAATFPARLQLAADYQRQVMVTALAELDDRLERITTSPALTPAEKRQVLLALWEETSDTPEGRRARAIIETFLRGEGPSDR